jgi:hypothetical protein
MSDGSFAVWDPHRNYWREDIERPPAYVFSPSEVWNGLKSSKLLGGDDYFCNGLIRDWVSWQNENGESFRYLEKVLSVLSPSESDGLKPGKPTRISIDDARDMPTIKMPYNREVPVVHASSGIRRIIALAYFLVWAWVEHNQAAKLRGVEATNQITFLIDEIESHLHPNWQLRIVPALLNVMKELAQTAEVQLITVTHSPLIMASVEPEYKAESDAWFDINLNGNEVTLEKLPFEKHGEAGSWLVSEAFDLSSSRAIKYDGLINEASSLLEQTDPAKEAILEMYDRLVHALNPCDNFLFRWRGICEKKGWLK